MVWKLISYSEIKQPLPPYTSDYIVGIVEDGAGKRLVAQIDKKYKELSIDLTGYLKKIVGPNGEINTFVPSESNEFESSRAKAPKIEKIGIVGTGIMGVGIVQTAIQAGFEVIFKSRSEKALNEAIKKIEIELLKRMTDEEKNELLNKIHATTQFNDLRDADVIIECIIEDENAKKYLFKELDKICFEKTIFATNTSSLSINELASVVSNPEKVIGIHFFNPVPKMRLVEIACGEHTSQETIEIATNFVKQLGKTPIVVGDSPGFIVNRILMPYLHEAAHILEEGIATADDIDTAAELGLNHPIGPLELLDLIGIDVYLKILQNLYNRTGDPKFKPCPLLEKMVKAGKLGKKTKEGFYQY